MSWLRANADRIALCVAGVALVVVALFQDRTPFATTLAILGVLVLVFGLILPRLRSFSLGVRGLTGRMDKLEKKVDGSLIRNALAEFIVQGDRIANDLDVARQMFIHAERQKLEPQYDETVWGRFIVWSSDVKRCIRDTPELGEADAKLFTSHGAAAVTSLKLPERFESEIALVRERQDRIRELMKRFE